MAVAKHRKDSYQQRYGRPYREKYSVTGKQQTPREQLLSRVQREYWAYLTLLIYKKANHEALAKVGMSIGLRSMIVAELPNCLLPEEKINELMDSVNALDLLTNLCQPILEPSAFEINDMISSCRTIIGELERRGNHGGGCDDASE